MFDAVIKMDKIPVIIILNILILISIFYYIGFLLPNKLAELLGAIEK